MRTARLGSGTRSRAARTSRLLRAQGIVGSAPGSPRHQVVDLERCRPEAPKRAMDVVDVTPICVEASSVNRSSEAGWGLEA